MPGGFVDSVAAHQQNLMASDWAKAGVQPEGGWRFFGDFLCVQKVTRVRGGEPREPKPEAAGFGCAGVRGAEPPMKSTGVWGRAAPDSKHKCRSSPAYSSSWRFSRATRTASTTKAEKVQSLPRIAFSTCSTTSLGKRMLLFVVEGTLGILNFLTVRHLTIQFI